MREPKHRDGCIADVECQAERMRGAASCWLSKGLTLAPRLWAPFFWIIQNRLRLSALALDKRRAPRARIRAKDERPINAQAVSRLSSDVVHPLLRSGRTSSCLSGKRDGQGVDCRDQPSKVLASASANSLARPPISVSRRTDHRNGICKGAVWRRFRVKPKRPPRNRIIQRDEVTP
jgi:hypothetical protein